ncbi:hypothetical protein FGB62_93g024 [Gracilaria domingensis]|nr:hypothetical protein FGB62_93g024 [Gracilaria domingensis]
MRGGGGGVVRDGRAVHAARVLEARAKRAGQRRRRAQRVQRGAGHGAAPVRAGGGHGRVVRAERVRVRALLQRAGERAHVAGRLLLLGLGHGHLPARDGALGVLGGLELANVVVGVAGVEQRGVARHVALHVGLLLAADAVHGAVSAQLVSVISLDVGKSKSLDGFDLLVAQPLDLLVGQLLQQLELDAVGLVHRVRRRERRHGGVGGRRQVRRVVRRHHHRGGVVVAEHGAIIRQHAAATRLAPFVHGAGQNARRAGAAASRAAAAAAPWTAWAPWTTAAAPWAPWAPWTRTSARRAARAATAAARAARARTSAA